MFVCVSFKSSLSHWCCLHVVISIVVIIWVMIHNKNRILLFSSRYFPVMLSYVS